MLKKKQIENLKRLTPVEFQNAPKLPLRVLLDDIRSLMNVGAIFRSADAFRIEKIYLTGITGTPPHPLIRKTALGATESVSWEKIENPVRLLKQLKKQQWKIIGVEQIHGAELLPHFQWNAQPTLLIFGNEVKGLTPKLLPFLDQALEIPQFGTKHSINVAVCAGIVFYHFFKDLKMSFDI